MEQNGIDWESTFYEYIVANQGWCKPGIYSKKENRPGASHRNNSRL